jgi:phospholipase C
MDREVAVAAAVPIKHVVIVMKENHTFDNYFGTFPGTAAVNLPHAPDPVPDPRHDHAGWLRSARAGGLRQQYTKQDIPIYWAWAQQYTLCDRYFTDVASQSEPNHLFAIAADAPIIDNANPKRTYQPQPPFHMPSLPAALEAAGRSWRSYAESKSSYFDHIADLAGHRWNVPVAQFDLDAAAGTLPDVAWLYAPGGFSEHPGNQTGQPVVGPGMQWTADRIHALAAGPAWATTAVFLTWDDWGGWYDSVTPPSQQTWPGNGPRGYHGSQYRYGPRVPCLVLSPYASTAVNHTMSSHASLVKFCLRLFGLPAWNAPALDPHDPSSDMWDCFDFTAAPRPAPPSPQPA